MALRCRGCLGRGKVSNSAAYRFRFCYTFRPVTGMAGIGITETAGGVEFEVIVRPKARRNEVSGIHDNAVRVSVTVAPEKGKANEAILKLLSKNLGVPVSAIRIVGGEKSRRKRIRIEGITPASILELVGGDD